ncbi:MAG: DNA-directed RNA polymerase subunit A', partial [Nitrosotalea sp.]
VYDFIVQAKKGTLQLSRGLSAEEALEAYIVNELSKARDKAGNSADKSFDETNAGRIMATTGARGSSLNIGQMAGALGQQSIRGRRILKGYSNRALPHFKENDANPDGKGFVKSNYREGLSTLEFFFHAMGGREGLVDTAVRTQQSGYMQRRLINALEHLKLEYDGTVRDPHGHIIQFLYGEDGIDVAKSDHGEAFRIARLIESESIIDSGKKATKEEITDLVKKYVKTFNPRLSKTVLEALLESKLSKEGVDKVCKKALELYDNAKVEPGQAVGVVTAQSIGEPGTQMTLRTFHFAGIRERNVTLGLPRLIELVDARKKPVTPTMDIYLEENHKKSKEKAIKVAREILHTKISALISSTETDYSTKIKLNLNQDKLRERACTIEDVVDALQSSKKKFEIEPSGNSITLTLPEESDTQTVLAMRNKILSTTVKGVTDVERVTIVQQGEEWVIQTSGSNIAKVWEIDGIDKKNIRTNN